MSWLSDRTGEVRSGGAGRTWAILIVLVVFALLYPSIVESLQDFPLIGDFVPSVDSMVVMIVFTMMAVGLNVVVGYAGLLDLGYVAFYAAGAYTAGWFASGHFDQFTFHFLSTAPDDAVGIHISMWLVLIIAGVFTTIVGHPDRPADAPAPRRLPRDRDARVRRDRAAVRPERRLDRGLRPDERHVRDQPDRLARLRRRSCSARESNRAELFYWAAVGLLLFTVFCCWRLQDSRLGRAWIAIREDETAAAAMGVPLMRTKTWSYAIGAFFGGVAGAFYASFKSGAFPADFYFNISVFLLCMVILGGMGSLAGVILGGMILGYLNIEGLATIGSKMQEGGLDFDPTKYQFGIYGVIIVLMMLFRPTGLIPERRHKIEMAEGVHDTPMYDVTHEGALTDRDRSND